MQLNKLLKSLFIALPVVALSACSSSDSATNSTAGQESTNAAESQTTNGAEVQTDTIVVTSVQVDEVMTEAEVRAQAEQELRQINTVFFAFNNSAIAPEYDDILAAHAAFLSADPSVKVTVEGHADERGTPEYNIALGERRAKAVSKYLQALGVSADQISIVSYGEEKPLVLGHTAEDYAKNRRAVLVY
ncbi:peptidoglycan-associated lipoprotein Pal [Aliivibrio finisterrensis]|uniref:Peptidoglycan-associated lipoprotein n=1 Tax=Aliivibrio finisterrensis TaxID=511998 RepID=A0A6N6RYG0_9GAMM|nr:peptidoglycan-associated lipoprotein Pal [Aliivibrio finisterrensis]KAB2826493.1 peptidoglycan-associated lipoprotein Pal [Aliivibrio finisterrensis]